MLQLIRSYQQTQPDETRTYEVSLHRSDSFVYVMSLVGKKNDALWTGELGLLFKPRVGSLLRDLGRLNGSKPSYPLFHEAPISLGATVQRVGPNGELRKEACSDIGSVTLYFASAKMLEQFVNELETALAWAS